MANKKIPKIEEKIGIALFQFLMTNDEEDVSAIFLSFLKLPEFEQALRDRLRWKYNETIMEDIIFQVFDVLDASLRNVECDWCTPLSLKERVGELKNGQLRNKG